MLTLPPMATASVRQLVAATRAADAYRGLRIAPGEPRVTGRTCRSGSSTLRTRPTAPSRLDGVDVSLEPTVVDLVDDKLLDVTVDSGTVRSPCLP